MHAAELLILHGPPGSGKSTLANAISDKLREADVAHAVIDVDELARTYPEQDRSFQWDNLCAIWPRYAAITGLKTILPVLIDTAEDLKQLREAVPAAGFTICELTASSTTLKERVAAREPNEYWQGKLRALVDKYHQRKENQNFGDFRVSTQDSSIDEVANGILHRMGWLT